MTRTVATIATDAASDTITIDAEVPGNYVRWIKYELDYTDFAVSGTTQLVKIDDLPPGAAIEAALMYHTTAFTGGSISYYTVELVVDGNDYGVVATVHTAPGGAIFTFSDSSPYRTPFHMTNFVDIEVDATSTGDNLDQATQGTLTVYLKVSEAKAATGTFSVDP